MFENLNLHEALLPAKDFRLFHGIDVEQQLRKVPLQLRQLLLAKAERWVDYSFPVIPQSCWQEYRKYGNRYNYEIYFVDRWLALVELLWAELLEGKGRFIDKMMDVIWMMEECTTWVIPPHSNYQMPVCDGSEEKELDLYAAESGAILSLAYYFFADEFEKRAPGAFNGRIRYEIERRIFQPFLHSSFHWFKKSNNWNIWICSNLLIITGIMEKDDARRAEILSRCLESADVYASTFPEDGFCPEGPRYFMLSCGCFFDFTELLYDLTGGKVDYTRCQLVDKMLTYPLYFHRDFNTCVNFGDAETCLKPDAIQLRRVAQRLGRADVVAYTDGMYPSFDLFHHMTCNHYRRLKDLLYSSQMPLSDTPAYTAPLPCYAPTLAAAFMGNGPLYLAAKASNNQQPHGHDDTGSFMVFCNSVPLLIDPGLDTYSQFGWNAQISRYRNSRYHNLPIINGLAQFTGQEAAAKQVQYTGDSFSYELTDCYPAKAGLVSLTRSIVSADKGFTVTDSWELNAEGTVEIVLMSKEKPVYDTQNNCITFGALPARVSYTPGLVPVMDMLDPAGAENCPEIYRERSMRIDYRKVAPRLASEGNVLVPFDVEQQWEQYGLYRTRLQARSTLCGSAVVTVEAL